ncbi:MAG: hypothetical protein AAGH15_05130 [Myxococcota bacterium]
MTREPDEPRQDEVRVRASDLLRVLRRFLSPRLATKALEALEEVAAQAPRAEPAVELTDIERANARRKLRRAGVYMKR